MSEQHKVDEPEKKQRRSPSALLGSITGRRRSSGTLSVTGTGSFEVMSGQELDLSELSDETLGSGRSRANTAPEPQMMQTTPHLSLASVSETTPVEEEQGSEEDDDELKIAKAMALAIQNNPNLTPDEIRQLVGTGNAQQQQQQQAHGKDKKTARTGSAFRSMRESLQKGVGKGRLSEILTGSSIRNVSSEDASDTPNSTSDNSNNAAPLSNTSASSKESSSKRGGHFRQSARNVRSPPISPNPNPGQVGQIAIANALSTSAVTREVGNLVTVATPSGVAGVAAAVQTPPEVAAMLPTVSGLERYMSGPSTHSSTANNKPFAAPAAPIRLAGIAWKRRSGLGKYSTTGAWERRRIELQGSKLFYYRTEQEAEDEKEQSPVSSMKKETMAASFAEDPRDNEGVVIAKKTSWFEQAAEKWTHSDDPTAPRGYIDLVKEKATTHVAFGHTGAPSPFAISIKKGTETKWKFCFDYHKQQMEWLAALTDVVVQTSIDAYNANLLEAADPANQADAAYFPPDAVNEPPTSGKREADAGQHRLWMMGAYTIRSQDNAIVEDEADDLSNSDAEATLYDDHDGDIREVNLERNVSGDGTATLDPKVIQSLVEDGDKKWNVPDKNLLHVAAVLNIALAFAQASSTSMEGFWYVFAFANLGLFLCLSKDPDWEKVLKDVQSSPAATAQSANPGKATAKSKASVMPAKGGPAKPKVPGFMPEAGTTAVKLKNATDPPENKLKQMFAGWRSIPGETLSIRSHGYASTKKKVSSPGEMYNCTKVDVFESPTRYPDMATRVKLPKIEYDDGGAPKTWRSPDVFIMSIALPTDPPKLGRNSSDGSGYTVTIYFTMTQETRDILRRVTADGYDASKEQVDDVQKSKVNAVRLFEEWCRRAPTDPKFMSRFKVVPNAHNLKEIGMPGWISKYNGKPFLIKRPGQTGFLFSHPELSCMEFDISLHPFPYLAKQGICYMKDSYFKKILVSFGFVIEGRADDELPECLIGVMQLCYPDPIHAIQADTFFAGTCNRSF